MHIKQTYSLNFPQLWYFYGRVANSKIVCTSVFSLKIVKTKPKIFAKQTHVLFMPARMTNNFSFIAVNPFDRCRGVCIEFNNGIFCASMISSRLLCVFVFPFANFFFFCRKKIRETLPQFKHFGMQFKFSSVYYDPWWHLDVLE